MKTLNRIFIVAFAMLFLGIVSQVGVHAASNDYYYSCDGIANAYEIDLSNEKLYACRDKITNPVNVENLVSYTNSITKSYQVHIYHYYVPCDGYYTAYTTGSKDTKIRLYRENQILWWIDGFIGFDRTEDDGSKCDNNYYNACSIEYLAKGYYYVAVRMHGTATGSYTINIGPNEDLIYRPRYTSYNRWICENNDPYYSGLRIYTNYIQYFTYEQTILFYWMLLDKEIDLGEYKEKYGMDSISPKTLLEIKDSNIPEVVDLIGFVVGIITAKATAGTSIAISAFFECASLATSMNYLTKQALITKIKNECKIKETAISYDTIKYSAEYCLGLKEWYTTDVPVGLFGYNYDVITYNSLDTYLRGEKNAKGKWAAM